MYARYGKRCVDIVVAVSGLIILSPLLLLVAASITLGDPGPVIFVQRRVGRDGRIFDFYKFRSMPINTPEMSSDAISQLRISLVGQFIRRTNIDELPQLVNIVLGDMSIVGPRPPIPSQIELIELRRVSGAATCRPGLTGLAQVSSYDGMSVAEKAAFDSTYAQSVSFFLDVSIIARTFLYLLRPPPKY